MTIEFVGGEMGAFFPSDSASSETTSASSFNSSFARCAIEVQGNSYVESADFKSGVLQDIWVHFEAVRGGASGFSVSKILEVVDNADVPVFKIETNSAGTSLQMYRWDGAAFQAVGAAVSVSMLIRQTIDVHIVGNSGTGTATLYIAGTERTTATADMLAVDDMLSVRHYGRSGSSTHDMHYSQTIVTAGETSIGMRLMTLRATGTGATDQMTGGYTAIDEIAYNDGDFIWSDTAAEVELFAATAQSSLTGYTVRAVGVTARANTDGTGPTQIQMAVRTGATNYFSSSYALGAGLGAYCGIWEDDPNTTLDWEAADASAIQFGVKSIA